MKNFPMLYSRNAKGSILQWVIWVAPISNDAAFEIVTQYGQRGGKIQESVEHITEGKNLGKANETTIEVQAEREALAKWQNQIDRQGYVESIEAIDQDIRPGYGVMLAQTYGTYVENKLILKSTAEKIKFPCIVQPKLDGHRCTLGADHKLYSRKREQITGLPHIDAACAKIDDALDGELYNHTFRADFEKLSGFIRSKTPKPGYGIVQYHVYDINMPGTFEARRKHLLSINQQFNESMWLVPSYTAQNQKEVEDLFRRFEQQGYEGAILRNLDSSYQSRRTYDLQKFKALEDDEFKIVGIKEGKGRMKGKAIFTCILPKIPLTPNVTFDVKMKGSMENLKSIYENQDRYIGQYLTVYFDQFLKSGKPRFPVGIRLREDL